MSSADGTWNCTISSPMGDRNVTLNLNTDGDSLSGSMAAEGNSIDLADGKLEGNVLSWTAQISQPVSLKLSFTVSVTDDELSGSVELGGFGQATIKGSR